MFLGSINQFQFHFFGIINKEVVDPVNGVLSKSGIVVLLGRGARSIQPLSLRRFERNVGISL